MIRELKTGVEWPKYNRENPMEYNERRLYRTKIFVRLLDKRYHGFKRNVGQRDGWESAPVKSRNNRVCVYFDEKILSAELTRDRVNNNFIALLQKMDKKGEIKKMYVLEKLADFESFCELIEEDLPCQ